MRNPKFILTTLLSCCAFIGIHSQNIFPLGIPDLEEDSRFGHSVDINENWACIAAPFQVNDLNVQEGAVYVFDRNTSWQHTATLLSPEGRQYDHFGYGLSAYDNTIAVGAPGKGSGIVYIYEYNGSTWVLSEVVKPVISSGHYINEMRFGFHVTITAQFLFVSAPDYLNNVTKEACVFVYKRNGSGWEFVQRLVHPQGQLGTLFGHTFEADGDRLIVGAPKGNGSVPGSGTAFLYELNGDMWVLRQQFIYPGSFAHERFGYSVGIHGDRVIIGSMMHVFDETEGPKGAAHIYVYSAGSWFHAGMLTNDDTARNDFYAQNVEIEGDIAVVGATRSNYLGKVNTGSVHVFKFENGFWSLRYDLRPDTSRLQSHMYFGGAFALHGRHLLIGSHLEDNTRNDSGNSYVHDLGDLILSVPAQKDEYAVYEISPNPFRQKATITFDLPAATDVRIEAYDANGNTLGIVADGRFPAGQSQSVRWETAHLQPGAYFIRITAGSHVATLKGIQIQ